MSHCDIFEDDQVVFWQTVPGRLWPTMIKSDPDPTDVFVFEQFDEAVEILFQNPAKQYDGFVFDTLRPGVSMMSGVAELLHRNSRGEDTILKTCGDVTVCFVFDRSYRIHVITLAYRSVPHLGEKRWHAWLWQHPIKGVWPDWGAYRDRGTRYLFAAHH